MPELRVLICDDEPGMRLIMRKIVERVEGFAVVGEAATGPESVELFARLRPEVVFLDVDMPGMSGVDCAQIMADIDPVACLVFATAHEQYRREAFEVYAFDYLVKPFPIERVQETLERIRARRGIQREETPRSMPGVPGLKKLMVRGRDGVTLVDQDEILLVQREERTTVLYTADEKVTTSEGLNDLMERLDSEMFFRCHKSYIVNVSMISKIYPYGRWTYLAKLKNTEQDVLITADKYAELEARFNG